jgi:hypothetical protein
MAYTQTQLDALEEALAKGVIEVSYGDRSVKYRSLREMRSLRDEMRRALGKIKRTNRRKMQVSKGL